MERIWAPWRMDYVGVPPQPGCFICRAAAGGAEASRHLVVARRASALVMLNRYPYNAGHLMVAPFRHVDGVEALESDEILDCWRLASDAKRALGLVGAPDGYNLGINQGKAGGAGLADHLHLHVVPRWEGDHNFMTVLADLRVVPQALEATRLRLREAFAGLGYPDPDGDRP